MQVILGTTDLTAYVQEKTYNVDAEDDYTAWQDAGGHDHRGGYLEKVKGSFDLVFFDGYSENNVVVDHYGDFLTLIANNSTDKRLTMKVSVNNKNNLLKEIVCYYELKSKPFRYANNGSNVIVKRVTMTIEER